MADEEDRLGTADLVQEADDVDARSDESGEREPLFSGEDADSLVAELMQRLAETFSQEREQLESQWDGDGDVSTEDLRVALQRYRSFFDRLLSA